MKNNSTFLLILLLFFGYTNYAQVGIGTTSPNANSILDLTATDKALLLPRVASTAAVLAPVNGMVIYDLSSNCVKLYQNLAWSDCLGAPASPTVVNNCALNGFEGTYTSGFAMVAANKFTVTVTNNAFATANISFAPGDLVLSGVSGLTVSAVTPTSVALLAGQAQLVTYTLTGTPAAVGTLTGTWNKLSLNCVKTKAVTGMSGLLATNYCTNAAVNGSYVSGVALGVGNTFSVTLTNTSGVAITGMPAPAIANLTKSYSGSGTINVASVSPSTAFNLAIGASQTITYTFSGTPTSSGILSLDWSYGDLTCSKTKNIGLGDAAFANDLATYVFSANDPAIPLNTQGTLQTGTTGSISYTSGLGSYIAYTSTDVNIPAAYCEDGASDWTFAYSYAAGVFATSGSISVTFITKKAGLVTPWPAKRVALISTINFSISSLPWLVNGNSYGKNVLLHEGGDVIRGSISLAGDVAGATAYDAGAENSYIPVTEASYNKLNVLVTGITNFGQNSADASHVINIDNQSYWMFKNNIPTTAIIFAFKVDIANATSCVQIMKQQNTIGAVGMAPWSSFSHSPNNAAGAKLFYVLKRPNIYMPANTNISITAAWGYGSAVGGNGIDGCTSDSRSAGGSYNYTNCNYTPGTVNTVAGVGGIVPSAYYLSYGFKWTTLKQW